MLDIDSRNSGTISTVPSSTVIPGSLWRDAHKNRNHRLLLVLDVFPDHAICQALLTGKVSKIRIEQFNRCKTGFFYAGSLVKTAAMYLEYTLSKE
jgi:hypothetical protein